MTTVLLNGSARPRARMLEAGAVGEKPVVTEWARRKFGFEATAGQAAILDAAGHRVMLCCSRQWGKTTLGAIRAVYEAWHHAGALVVVGSPSDRQSGFVMEEAERLLLRLGVRRKRDGITKQSLVLPNGSRVVGLPASEATTRGYSNAHMLLIDEAAYMRDREYRALRGILARSDGALWLMSTPAGQRGFFYTAWMRGEAGWERVLGPATECPHITAKKLEEERAELGEALFRQEYLCEFLAAPEQVFSDEVVQGALVEEGRGALAQHSDYYVGLDLGLKRDYTAMVVLEKLVRRTGRRNAVDWTEELERVTMIRRVERAPLETPYAEVPEWVGRVMRGLPEEGTRTLLVDATGVGAPVLEMLRAARLPGRMSPVVITGGQNVGLMKGAETVPRAALLENLRALLETGVLRAAAGLAGWEELRREMLAMGRQGGVEHDDLVFALALAAWGARSKGVMGWGGEALPGTPVGRHGVER